MYDILIKNAQLRRKTGLWNIAIEKGLIQKITKKPIRAKAGKQAAHGGAQHAGPTGHHGGFSGQRELFLQVCDIHGFLYSVGLDFAQRAKGDKCRMKCFSREAA